MAYTSSVRRIDSAQNPLVKQTARLKERRQRDREGLYLIEGQREVQRALAGGVVLKQLWFCHELVAQPSLLDDYVAELELLDVELIGCSSPAFSKLSYREKPDGIIAVAQQHKTDVSSLVLSEQVFMLVIDGLEKPGNIGALLRTADAVKVDAVLITGTGTDLYNPNVIRSRSMGSLFSQPVIALEAHEAIHYLKSHNISLITTSPAATQRLWDVDLKGRCAIVLGTEHEGLSEQWFKAADVNVTIPMHGMADSLNVATSGALLLYEGLRQRSA